MTDEELIARLRSNIFGTGTTMLAADRIEALTEQLAAARQDAKEAEDYAEEVEAKLAKAVEALEYYNVAGHEGKEARAILAEIKGDKP